MERTPVQSSNVAEIGYDAATMTLEVAFKNGGIYQYFDVPDTLFQELMRAPSAGKYLHANIRDRYRCTKL